MFFIRKPIVYAAVCIKFSMYLCKQFSAYVVCGASGDEWGELIWGKGTIGLQAAVPKKPPTRDPNVN